MPPAAPDFWFLEADFEAAMDEAQHPPRSEREADPNGAEARRVAGVARVIERARAALREAGDPNRLGAIPLEARELLMLAGLRILIADDQEAAVRRFLGKREPQSGKGKTGRPPEDNTDRDIRIAAYVAELRASGMSRHKACEQVGKRLGIPVGFKSIEAAYDKYRDSRAVRATLGFRRAMLEENPDDPPPKIEQQITPRQQDEYLTLAAALCPNGMTAADNLELWSFVRRASFP